MEDDFSTITLHSLSEILSEKSSLAAEISSANTHLKQLSYANYSRFLAAEKSGSLIEQSLAETAEVSIDTSKLLSLLADFSQRNSLFSTNQLINQRIYNNVGTLESLLEIPVFFSSLVKAGYYEEALELLFHSFRLFARHPNIPLLTNISIELSYSTNLMLSQLIDLIASDVKLPLCIRVIGYLRRMEAFPEPELRIIFLQQRNSFLQQLLNNSFPQAKKLSDPFEYLRKFIEISREHFFDIVTQYRSIFASSSTNFDQPNNSSTSNNYRSRSNHAKSSKHFLLDSTISNASTNTILSSFTIYYVNQFETVLEENVWKLKDANQLNSILTQTMYFGTSLGRIGVDFRPAVVGIFESAMSKLVVTRLESGLKKFVKYANDTNLSQIQSKNYTTPTTPTTISTSHTQLLPFPPLAALLNIFFTAFNHLRILPLQATFAQVNQSIVKSLDTVCDTVERFRGAMGEAVFEEVCFLVVEVLGRAVLDGVKGVYGGECDWGCGNPKVLETANLKKI